MSTKLADFLVPNAVSLNLAASDAREVIDHLGKKLFKEGYVKDTFVAAALDRESRLPTGLPLGGEFNAAIPHTEIEHVLKPGVAMATLKTPVIFQNMVSPEEAVPVRLVFVMALDQPKSQVEMLQEIAGVLQSPEVVAALMKAACFADVQKAFQDL